MLTSLCILSYQSPDVSLPPILQKTKLRPRESNWARTQILALELCTPVPGGFRGQSYQVLKEQELGEPCWTSMSHPVELTGARKPEEPTGWETEGSGIGHERLGWGQKVAQREGTHREVDREKTVVREEVQSSRLKRKREGKVQNTVVCSWQRSTRDCHWS